MKIIRFIHKKLLVLFGLVLLGGLFYTADAYATSRVEITTIIDNESEYPAEVAALSTSYTALGIYTMKNTETGSYLGYMPDATSTKSFIIRHNNTQVITYNTLSGTSVESIWFQGNTNTDNHLSLNRLEFSSGDNARQYIYYPDGDTSHSHPGRPINWVEVINQGQDVKITVHFQYNPDIDQIPSEPDPSPDYSKRIDYLGDGGGNSDTGVSGLNDYRLYLDFTTQEAAEESKADIVFVLDISQSMTADLSGKSRMEVLKETMVNSINSLTSNPKNRISIIAFHNASTVLVSNSTDKTTLLDTINGLSAAGMTNYYASLQDAVSQINLMAASDTENREKVIIFITDGDPTYSLPVTAGNNNTQCSITYAFEAAQGINNVDRFYSIYIGDSGLTASNLQTITQMVTARKEKYMVQATSAVQVSSTLDRFLSKMGNTLYDVSISDTLSQYADYGGALKVVRSTGGGSPVTMTLGTDYQANVSGGVVEVRFLNATISNTRYTVSFNIRSSDAAINYFNQYESYPNVGDGSTDYGGNNTSSDKAGLYSNQNAILAYSFGGAGYEEKTYLKPVLQVVPPPPAAVDIRVSKRLTGKILTAGMFSFELYKIEGSVETLVETVMNEADGAVVFSSLPVTTTGDFSYRIKEKIPSPEEAGMTYDRKEIDVTVRAVRSGDNFVVSVLYPQDTQFVNVYQPDPVNIGLEVNKVLTGRDLQDGEFEFKLFDDDSNALLQTSRNMADGKVQFADITYTAAGVYQYTIREIIPAPQDRTITYDTDPVLVRVTVSDSGGRLEAQVEYTPDAIFENRFDYIVATATIEMRKILTGMQLSESLFTFEIRNLDSGETETVGNEADGKVLFNFSYSEPGTYRYEVREIVPEETDPEYRKYMTYDGDKRLRVEVQVEEDEENPGILTETVTYVNGTDFYNSYQVKGAIQ